LLEKLKPILPNKMNVHLSPHLLDVFGKENRIEYYGFNNKMQLTQKVSAPDDKNIRKLGVLDLPIIQKFYKISYPNNWFDSRMLLTDKYYGYFIHNQLIGISGVHVYSAEYKAAVLGNIATHPQYRGQQIGTKLTSALCSDLQQTVDVIGLNVKANNEYAIKCYEKIGFKKIGMYDECLLRNTNS